MPRTISFGSCCIAPTDRSGNFVDNSLVNTTQIAIVPQRDALELAELRLTNFHFFTTYFAWLQKRFKKTLSSFYYLPRRLLPLYN